MPGYEALSRVHVVLGLIACDDNILGCDLYMSFGAVQRFWYLCFGDPKQYDCPSR